MDIIKIDGSFILDMMGNKVNITTVEAICGIAEAVGKQTIAEFVESEEVLKELERIGVNFAQGYHFQEPEALKDLAMVKLNYLQMLLTRRSAANSALLSKAYQLALEVAHQQRFTALLA